MRCANPDCGETLSAFNRAKENSSFCVDCGSLVYAFRPDSQPPSDWYLVADGGQPVVGQAVQGGQCENCYLSEFLVDRDGKFTWFAICAGQVADGTFLLGCHATHPIRMKMRYEVIPPWPGGPESGAL